MKLAEGLQSVGKEYNATAGQVALAWLLAQGEDVIPIPGTKKIKVGGNLKSAVRHDRNTQEQYLEENLAAAHISLTPEAVQKVREIAEDAVWVGDRYPTSMSLSYGDTPAL